MFHAPEAGSHVHSAACSHKRVVTAAKAPVGVAPRRDVRATTHMDAERAVSVVDAEDDPRQLVGLDYMTWLPFSAKTYEISPNIEDYILVTTPICPSDIPNRNGIGFPLQELVRFLPPPGNRQAYKAWTGCPVHYEHKNDVHTEAYGVILDTTMSRVEGYGLGKLWKVMGLVAIDKKKYPKMAQRILTNQVNTYSMGAMVEAFSCSYCGTPLLNKWRDSKGVVHPAEHCSHLTPDDPDAKDGGHIDWSLCRDFDGSDHVAFRNAHHISPIELSIVESPAWTTALSDHILTR